MADEFHVEENLNVPETSKHRWLIETAVNVVVCAHRTQTEAIECQVTWRRDERNKHS